MAAMKKGGWMLVMVLIGLFSLMIWKKSQKPGDNDRTIKDSPGQVITAEPRGPAESGERERLNRKAGSLIYSKHARCRMGCRHISEDEVVDILRNGTINYGKSDMRGSPDPKYAIEGDTKDGQKVRIIFANSPRGIVVVTVIDLENEWKCNCK